MKKYFSLIKASMSEGMNLFRITTKKQSFTSKILIPLIIALLIMGTIYGYSEMMITPLIETNMEFVLLSIFVMFTSFLTLIEGIYKSGNLLFNCADDNMLFSLPIKKSIILFIRVFKFYLFELLYNSLFLLPAIICYAVHTNPSTMYYVVSAIGLFIFPIIPILISCLIGTVIVFISSRFKGKRFVQTLVTMMFLLVVFYVSFNTESLLQNIGSNATNINDMIIGLYYPANAFIKLVINFDALNLLIFVGIHLVLFAITILLIGKIFFKTNSRIKEVKTVITNKNYSIKTNSPMKALIKKELSRFVNSTVFITNAGFGLVLYVVGCVLLAFNFDGVIKMLVEKDSSLTAEFINSSISIIVLGLMSFTVLMTSITSSMISLEGKSFNILKSLPVKPYTIVKSKILAAILVMIPCIFLGDIIVFIRFRMDILSMIFILVSSVILSLVSETIGILVNLKYPRMDAKNDTEVVKQSTSSAICVFAGMGLSGATIALLIMALNSGIPNLVIMGLFTGIYAVIYVVLVTILSKTSVKSFNNIVV